MNSIRFKSLLFLTLFSLTFFDCSDDNNSSSNTQETSNITVKLVDNPGDYDHVYVDVVDVMVKVNDDSEDDQGWQSLEAINTGIYDLLQLTGGVNVLLADDYEIPSGTLNQIRLILGDDNTIVIDGETFALETPSAEQSGLKIQVNETLEPNFEYTFWLDFDVCQSIVVAGNSGNIILKPVIRATAEASTGIISGSISPSDVQTQISVLVDTDMVSTYTDENGNFTLIGLPSGSYEVTITPDPESGFIETTLEDIVVVEGQTTILETIELQ
ncbi:DUF4382 domain-containing protein [uncultured Psychroserpens sp.]|uniref:DUF4382 domain-containing protein n=1 Tax=uncultured Psychroserpens sp. TaxID=255436 RepID=UPI0026121374|nr:DUF4382 domain-containing protein [uncultured Psychroserpens sp.]